ncbi:MAG: hypothetical protein PHT44_00305 [Candidatus Portnoybacteria bacterium]|nr:hypothetical protein [Candidatus Portnoybacteria bacterium]MDD4982941.1 hypothetical protein [Candidatus Portnoybacteria bacterium]
MTPVQKIAALLRSPESVLAEIFAKMEKLTGTTGVAEKICKENEAIVKQKLKELGIAEEKADAQLVQAKLFEKTKEADKAFYEFLGEPDLSKQDGCGVMIGKIKEISGVKNGFFLQEEKLRDFLFLNPPKNILGDLGYAGVQEMLAKENLYEVFAALRFVENERWLNETFFRPYNDLTADNFEEREIKVRVLSEKWAKIGAKFVGKKLHHISHLKELGLVFIIPEASNGNGGVHVYAPGRIAETFSLVLHYIHEIDFYCELFRRYAKRPDFGKNIVDLLSGKASGAALQDGKISWRVIQRYLAKADPQDPRLFEPHVNTENLHWLRAEKEMDLLAEKYPQADMEFWRGADDFAGDIFLAGKKGEEIVSFDLIDNIVALTHGGLGKYLYHQQESLWNKIFMEFMGEEKLRELVLNNIEKGFIEL